MNEVLNNIYTRRSIRKFKEQDVPKDLVDEIVKAGTYAPSGKNLQTYRFYVMQNADSIKSLQDVVAKGMENPAYTLYGAKTIVLVACEKEAVNGVSDCSCAIENMLLAAHSLGLGACWINQLKYCGYKAEVADYLEGLGIDKDMQVVGMVGMGYPDEEREAAKRQDDLVTYLN